MTVARSSARTDPLPSTTLRFELRHSHLSRVGAIAAPIAELGLFGVLVSYGGIEPEGAALLLGLLWGISLGHTWFVFAAWYEVSDTTLRMVHGPWRREIALTDLLRVRLVRTLDRGPVVDVDVVYGRKLLLSPVEREELIGSLEARQPNLQALAAARPR